MKKNTFKFMVAMCITLTYQLIYTSVFAQAPEKINYQAVVRDSVGNIVADQQVAFRFSLLQGSVSGTVVYAETHTDTTNAYGLSLVAIGGGEPLTGTMAGINWENGPYFIKVELDPNGGTTFVLMGITQLLSVPYAFHSKTADSISGTLHETDPEVGVNTANFLSKWDGSSLITSTVFDNGKIGIGTNNPTALLHTNGTGTGEGNVLFVGNYKSSNPGSAPASGTGTRMMWYPDKAAFRAGWVSGTFWDTDSIGNYSIAMGYNNKAKGNNSTAWGTNTTASGSASTTMGTNTTASGINSTALGYITSAKGYSSTTMGEYTTAWGDASIATGWWTNASGAFSIATGIYTTAPSYCETVIGSYNTTYTPQNVTNWDNNDRLFVIGNGENSLSKRNAITILKNGNTGIGTDIPAALLHTNGSGTGGGNVLFTGQYKSSNPGPAPATGAGTRMMWYPDKSAFRAGYIDGTQWDTDSIGNYSVALGYNTKAKGYYSIAIGSNTTASGGGSFASGYLTKASGSNSTALGWRTEATSSYSTALGFFSVASGYIATAIGDYATASGSASNAMGAFTTAEGSYSTALGYNTIAPSYRETVIGSFNTTYTPLGGANSWYIYDRLFSVGNGASAGNESNALTMLKNGFTGLGTNTPSYQLQLSLNSAAKPTSNTWTIASDARLKTNIHDYSEGLAALLKIHPVWFTYTGEAGMPKETGVGVVAQELQKIAPYMVGTWTYRDEDGSSEDYLSVDNGAMIYMLINAVKEQQGIIEELKTQNSSMQLQINDLIQMMKK